MAKIKFKAEFLQKYLAHGTRSVLAGQLGLSLPNTCSMLNGKTGVSVSVVAKMVKAGIPFEEAFEVVEEGQLK